MCSNGITVVALIDRVVWWHRYELPWCSGYHIRLTRERSPVRSWAVIFWVSHSSSCVADSEQFWPPQIVWTVQRFRKVKESCILTRSSVTSVVTVAAALMIRVMWSVHRLPWCSGYHIRLTRGRSPVQSWAVILILLGMCFGNEPKARWSKAPGVFLWLVYIQ